MADELLNETQWREITAARLRRAGMNRETWDSLASEVIEKDNLRNYLLFVKNCNIPIIQDSRFDYPKRVFLSFHMIHLAILAKDEAQYREFVTEFSQHFL